MSREKKDDTPLEEKLARMNERIQKKFQEALRTHGFGKGQEPKTKTFPYPNSNRTAAEKDLIKDKEPEVMDLTPAPVKHPEVKAKTIRIHDN